MRTCKHLKRKPVQPIDTPLQYIKLSMTVPKILPDKVLISTKRDGLHILVVDGIYYTTKGYPIKYLKPPVRGKPKYAIEGEICCEPYFVKPGVRTTFRDVMQRLSRRQKNLKFYAFDYQHPTDGIEERLKSLQQYLPSKCIIKHKKISSEELPAMLKKDLTQGHEGVVFRVLGTKYTDKRTNKASVKIKTMEKFRQQ